MFKISDFGKYIVIYWAENSSKTRKTHGFIILYINSEIIRKKCTNSFI